MCACVWKNFFGKIKYILWMCKTEIYVHTVSSFDCSILFSCLFVTLYAWFISNIWYIHNTLPFGFVCIAFMCSCGWIWDDKQGTKWGTSSRPIRPERDLIHHTLYTHIITCKTDIYLVIKSFSSQQLWEVHNVYPRGWLFTTW